jgi:hypothetical protein
MPAFSDYRSTAIHQNNASRQPIIVNSVLKKQIPGVSNRKRDGFAGDRSIDAIAAYGTRE